MKKILAILLVSLMAATTVQADGPGRNRKRSYYSRQLRNIEKKRDKAQHKIHKKHCRLE